VRHKSLEDVSELSLSEWKSWRRRQMLDCSLSG